MRKYEQDETRSIYQLRDDALRSIRSIESGFNDRLTVDEMIAIEKLLEIARKNMTEEEILSAMKDFDKNMRKRSRERRFMKIKERFSKKKWVKKYPLKRL